jgi:hypothetical protein
MAAASLLLLGVAILVGSVALLRLHKWGQSLLGHIERIRRARDMEFTKDLRHRADLKAAVRQLENENTKLKQTGTRLRAERNEARDEAAGPEGWGHQHTEARFRYWHNDSWRGARAVGELRTGTLPLVTGDPPHVLIDHRRSKTMKPITDKQARLTRELAAESNTTIAEMPNTQYGAAKLIDKLFQ